MPKLYKVGRIWYADLRPLGRGRVSTRCTDRKAAVLVARRWEREAADPTHAAAEATTVERALELMLDDRESRGVSPGTLNMYETKAGHLARIFGADTPIARVDAAAVDDYIEQRFAEGVTRHTVTKELVTLRVTLKVARRLGLYQRHHEDVMPVGWQSGYTPRSRAPSPEEVDALIEVLPPHRAAFVAFVVATGARHSEAMAARPGDVGDGVVTLRGEKTDHAAREVPIWPWVERYLEHVELPLRRWAHGGCQRDLKQACCRAGIDPAGPNDLRRAAGTWLRERIGDAGLVGVFLGHADSKMAERTYAKLRRAEQLRSIVDKLMEDDDQL